MNEVIAPSDIKTAKQWIDLAKTLLAKGGDDCFLVDFRLITFDRIKLAPKDFQLGYFNYLTQSAFTVQEIAEEAGVSKEEMLKLMNSCGFSRKIALKDVKDDEPLLNLSAKDRKAVRDWISISDRKKTVDFNAIFDFLQKLNFECSLPPWILMDMQARHPKKGEFETSVRKLFDLPDAERQEYVRKNFPQGSFCNPDGSIKTDGNLLGPGLFYADDMLDHQVGVTVPQTSFATKETNAMKTKTETESNYKTAKDVLGEKPFEKMDENDMEKIANGLSVQPIRNFATALADDEYLKKVFSYFNYVPLTEAVRIMFGMGVGPEYYKLQKRLSRFKIVKICISSKSNKYLYAMGAFYGWFMGDACDGLDYVDKKGNLGLLKSKNNQSAPGTKKISKEEKSMKKEQNVNPYEEGQIVEDAPANTAKLANPAETAKTAKPTDQTDDPISVKITYNMAYIFRKLAEMIDDGAKVEILK